MKQNEELNINFNSNSTKTINSHLLDTRNSMVSELDKMTKISNFLCFFLDFSSYILIFCKSNRQKNLKMSTRLIQVNICS